MEIQGKILLTYGVLVLLTLALFIIVAASSRGAPKPYAEVQPRGYGVRRAWFWLAFDSGWAHEDRSNAVRNTVRALGEMRSVVPTVF